MPYTNPSTARLIANDNNSEVATAIRCLIYKRCTFSGHRVVRGLQKAIVLQFHISYV